VTDLASRLREIVAVIEARADHLDRPAIGWFVPDQVLAADVRAGRWRLRRAYLEARRGLAALAADDPGRAARHHEAAEILLRDAAAIAAETGRPDRLWKTPGAPGRPGLDWAALDALVRRRQQQAPGLAFADACRLVYGERRGLPMASDTALRKGLERWRREQK
jgi:hypothetical protein